MAEDIQVRVEGRDFSYRGETYDTGEELSVDEDTAENHPSTLERVDETENGSAESENAEENESAETENGYSRDELEDMDRSDLQRLATDADTDEINGRSSNEDIIDELAED